MRKPKLKTFEVRVTWMMSGTYFVKAENGEHALCRAQGIPALPGKKDSTYLESSIEYGEPERVMYADKN